VTTVDGTVGKDNELEAGAGSFPSSGIPSPFIGISFSSRRVLIIMIMIVIIIIIGQAGHEAFISCIHALGPIVILISPL
jgi:hypothetical protein